MLACPCCDHLTLATRDDFRICPVCFWEDEPDDGLVAGHNSGSIDRWEGKMKALINLMKGNENGTGWSKSMLLMSSFMRVALSRTMI